MTEPSVHDSFVCSFCHRLEDQVLTIISQYRDRETPEPYVKSVFNGVVAHHFQHVVAPSILNDIEETKIDTILLMHHALFESGLKYGWPFSGLETVAELQKHLDRASINGYRVNGSCGLDGFVLASSCSIQWSSSPTTDE